LAGVAAAEAQLAVIDFEQARRTRLEHPEAAAGAQPQLGEAADPTRLAEDLGDFGDFAGPHHVQREEHSRT